MSVKEDEIKLIIEKVLASIVSNKNEEKKLGLFDDMNVAIAKAREAQEVVKKMSLDFREKIIKNIRKKTLENAETFAKMAVEETGMGNFGDKILKHQLLAEKTPGTEDSKTIAWSGERGLTLVEMGPFGGIGAITPCTILVKLFYVIA